MSKSIKASKEFFFDSEEKWEQVDPKIQRQIHGTDDKNFPIKLMDNIDIVVRGGSHFMTYRMGPEIGNFIRSDLSI